MSQTVELASDGTAMPATQTDASCSVDCPAFPLRKNKRMLGVRYSPPRAAKRTRSAVESTDNSGVSQTDDLAPANVPSDGEADSLGSTACSPASSVMHNSSALNPGQSSSAASNKQSFAISPESRLSTGDDRRRSSERISDPESVALAELEAVNTKERLVETSAPETAAMLKISPVADAEGILWTKIKGHPYWPAQIVDLTSELLKDKRFKQSLKYRRRSDNICVQYFGTLEIAWIDRDKACISWADGIRKGFHLAMKKRHAYVVALQEVRAFCARQTKFPRGWWCEPRCLVLAAEFLEKYAPPGHPERKSSVPSYFDSSKLWSVARAERVMWAKMRGYPNWPIQVIPHALAQKLFPELKLSSGASAHCQARPSSPPGGTSNLIPCMFFGTGEVACISERITTDFDIGVRDGFVVGSDRYDFQIALGEAYGFLLTPRIWPSGYLSIRPWWNAPEDVKTNARASKESSKRMLSDSDESVPRELPHYEYIRRSVWPEGESPPPRSRKSEIPICVCCPKPRGSCLDNSCLNFMSCIICDPSTCPAGEKCANVSFHRRPKPTLTPFYTSDGRGWGLRTAENIRKGDFVIEYVGEMIDKSECERRLKAVQRRGDSSYFLMEITPDRFLDASNKGNLSRFINSSCSPNCATQKWIEASTGQTKIGIFAITDIAKGSEILYNYCFQDFSLASKKGKRCFTCRCGSPNCCTYEPGEYERTERIVGMRIKVKWDDGWYMGTVNSYDPSTKEFEILYDDGDTERLGLSENPKSGGDIGYKLLGNQASLT